MQYFHIFNRGIDSRNIFLDINDRQRFLLALHVSLLESSPKISDLERQKEKNNFTELPPEQLSKMYGPVLVDIIAFCLMPNHYHLLIKTEEPKDLSKFTQRLANSYTCFFNQKYSRTGRLFASKYKSSPIESDEQLIHLTRYIHTNPSNVKSNPLNPSQLKKYLWSSLPEYLEKNIRLCQINDVLKNFKSTKTFWEFTKSGIKNINDIILSNKLLIDY